MGGWLKRRAEDIAGLMLAAIFFAFVVQVFWRYVLNSPLTWTEELITGLWVWVIFWAGAFLLKESDHIKFDVLYNAFGPGTRRVITILTSLAIVAGFAVSLPASYDYVYSKFRFGRTTPILNVSFAIVYGVYLLFAVAMIVRYGMRIFRLLTGASIESIEKGVGNE